MPSVFHFPSPVLRLQNGWHRTFSKLQPRLRQQHEASRTGFRIPTTPRAAPSGPDSSYQSFRRAMWSIIGINSAVFGLWQYSKYSENRALQFWMHTNFTNSAFNLKIGNYWTIVTSAFSHVNTGHFLFNMVSFHAFSSIMSTVPGVGAPHAFILYFGSAFVSGLGQYIHQSGRKDQNGRQSLAVSLGASGAVMAFGVTASCLMPRAPIMVFFVPMPLWAATAGYIAFDLYSLESADNIGHAAHLGGALFGAAYYLLSLRRYGGIFRSLKR
ncbi:hypothetical protein K431DRAFT_232181 [Polychaeton citri CBS 116435]|uniref:Peptidase S54 rhomboid domain-containing protein n=1 Tax=Polychaeton citri CBS 116435 TaxID=1314669 RepID=A0A9P4Q1X5_9PEZI|nr:hypothetical protein K431DRAFT_232181 [Polychaeton citri CBS 116435]